MDKVTVDKIIEKLQEWVENRQPIDAHTWLDAAGKITVLLGDEHDKLFAMKQSIANHKYHLMSEGLKSSAAQAQIETTDEFRQSQEQEAKIKRVEEMVRISKIRAQLAKNERDLQH